MRDPDRTTLEFERNDGGDEPPAEPFSGAHIGWGVPLDHVGVRTRAPHERHLDWAARNLGFTLCVSKYAVNPDPLKNGRPMVTRSPAGADINFIPNGNTPPPEPEGSEAPLFCGGVLKPGAISPTSPPAHAGILYVTRSPWTLTLTPILTLNLIPCRHPVRGLHHGRNQRACGMRKASRQRRGRAARHRAAREGVGRLPGESGPYRRGSTDSHGSRSEWERVAPRAFGMTLRDTHGP